METEQQTVITEKREKTSAGKKIFSIAAVAVIIVLLLALIALVLQNSGTLNIFGARDSSTVSDDGSFCKVIPASVIDFKPFGSGLAVLTGNKVLYFDSSGRTTSDTPHAYTNPVMEVNGKNLLLYDRGGLSLSVARNGKIVWNNPLPSAVTCAVLGGRNNFAYSLNDDGGFRSHVYVKSFNGNDLFEWGSGKDYCICLSLSHSKNLLAVGLIGTDNAELYSMVVVFDITSKKELYSALINETAVYSVEFVGDKVYAYSDSGLFLVCDDGNCDFLQDYTSAEIKHSDYTKNGLKATAISVYGNDKNSEVHVFSRSFRELYVQNYEEPVTGLLCNRSNVCVILGSRFEVIGKRGQVIGSVGLGEVCRKCVSSGHYIYLLTSSALYRYSVTDKKEIDPLGKPKGDDGSDDDFEVFTTEEDIVAETVNGETVTDEIATDISGETELTEIVSEENTGSFSETESTDSEITSDQSDEPEFG